MSKKRIISLILIFFVCSNFLFQVLDFSDWSEVNEIGSPLRISGDHATLEWVSIYDDPDPSRWDKANDVAIDSFGNVYSVGESKGGMIIVKYNSKGDYILNRTWYPGSGYAKAKKVILDSSNNIYVAGNINAREDIILLKYNSDCMLQWVRIWDGSSDDFLHDIAKDSSDNIFLSGSTKDSFLGTSDILVIKYNSSGNQLWNRTWGGLEGEAGNSLAIDSSDNIVIGGTTSEGGDLNMVLLKYNNLGVLQWDVEWERGPYWERGEGVVIDSTDNIFIGVIDIDNYIPILVKFDDLGNEVWNKTYQGLEFYSFDEMEIDSFDNIYLAATFEYRIFGFAKINKFGDFLWKETWGTTDDEICTSLALNSTEHIYLAGYRSFHSYGSMILVKFKLNSPEIPYFIDLQENFAQYEGDITKSLIWTPIDDSSFYDSYWIMQNGTIVAKGSWDGSRINYSELGGLLPGIYNFTCFVNNTYGKLNSSSIIVSILNNLHAPNIIKNTKDTLFNIGTSNYIISWFVIDLDGNNNSYWIKRNLSMIESGTWDNDSNITFIETKLLDVGIYNYTCYVNDTSGLKNQTSINIQIINHNPIIYNKTADFVVNLGTIGYSLTWYASDIDGNTLTYWIERNGFLIYTDNWVNNSDIIYSEAEFLNVGIYNYTCYINDSIGVANQSSIFVRINSYPYFSNVTVPSDNIYTKEAVYIFNCKWVDLDGMIEDVLFEFGNYNFTVTTNMSEIFTYELKDLGANENGYSFRWHAIDNNGALTSTGWENYILYKREIEFKILFNGTEDNHFDDYDPLINITVINLNSTPGTINLFVGGSLKHQEVGYVLTNISQYSLGRYNFTAILTDENYTGFFMRWLYLNETVPPEIIFEFSEFYVSPTEPEYFQNQITLICTVNDFSFISWVYSCENSSGIFSNHSMTSLGNGNWTYIIDISGLSWNNAISISFYAKDIWGNLGLTKFYTIEIHDFQDPITMLSFIPYESTTYVNHSTLISLVSDDGFGSGLENVKYKINESEWLDYNIPFNLNNYTEGYYNISYYSTDLAGNVEEINSFIVKLIKIPQDAPRDSPAIPGFDILLVIGLMALYTSFLTRKKIRSHFKNQEHKN